MNKIADRLYAQANMRGNAGDAEFTGAQEIIRLEGEIARLRDEIVGLQSAVDRFSQDAFKGDEENRALRAALDAANKVPNDELVLPAGLGVGFTRFGKGIKLSTVQGAIDRMWARLQELEPPPSPAQVKKWQEIFEGRANTTSRTET